MNIGMLLDFVCVCLDVYASPVHMWEVCALTNMREHEYLCTYLYTHTCMSGCRAFSLCSTSHAGMCMDVGSWHSPGMHIRKHRWTSV